MRHFYRTHMPADRRPGASPTRSSRARARRTGRHAARARTFTGAARHAEAEREAEGGHYTFVEVDTDQMGESRLDRNVKRFFVELHRSRRPAHTLEAAY